jgi:hypothetical protein
MAAPQSFLDNLKNFRLVMSVALEHAQENRDQFLISATGEQPGWIASGMQGFLPSVKIKRARDLRVN